MGINIGITGLHAADNPAPGIGVIRSLRHPDGWDGKIVGLGYDVMDTGIYDDGLLDDVYLIPYPNQGFDAIFERLAYIHSQVRLDVIIPTLDSELALYQSLEPRLKEIGISLFLPSPESTKNVSKAYIDEFCQEIGIPSPKTFVVKTPSQLDEGFKEIGFPLMVKGIFYEAYHCENKLDALSYFDKIKLKWGLPIILQKVIKAEEFDICCVGSRDGDLLGSVPIRKTRLTDKGKAWAAITIKNPELDKLSKKIIKGLKWAGPCELEILQEKKTNKYYLLEVNPRFPAWIYLCTGAEQNLPKLVVDLALGKDVKPMPCAKSGMTFVRHATDLVCPIEHIEHLTTLSELHYTKSGKEE